MAKRRVRKVVKAHATLEGAGVHLQRAIGLGQPEEYDPFLLLDDFRSDVPADYRAGFPWHPHRGMETITYVLAGKAEHQDSLGNRGVIGPGDVQWMSAGSGIIHQEMPQGDERGRMYGLQLWANLPASAKMAEPRYQGIRAADIPEVVEPGGARIKVIAGTIGEVRGPAQDIAIQPQYLDVSLPPGATFVRATPRGHTVFAYVIEGHGVFNQEDDPFEYEAQGESYFDEERDRLVGNRHLVSFGDGDSVEVSAGEEPLRFLLISGKLIGEPIAWRGPIVMNTQAELRQAFEELDRGTFIKHT
jgi:quercetin 2,3-dioxygenase